MSSKLKLAKHNALKTLIHHAVQSQQCKQLVISAKLLTLVSHDIVILQIPYEKLLLQWSFMFSGLTASLTCVVSSADITFATTESTTGIQ